MTSVAPAHGHLRPDSFSVVESLRGGQRVEIRAIRRADVAGLMAALDRTSDHSLSRRFFGAKRHFSEKEIAYFVDVDFVTHVALVAVVSGGDGAIVAGARYIVVRPGTTELAFVVVDDWQGQGLASALLRHLTALARAAQIREFVAEVLADNQPMLRVFERSGLRLRTRRDGAVTHVTLQL